MTEGHPGFSPGSTKIYSAPTLETDRLLLRHWRKEDFRPWLAIQRQPAVHRHFGPEPITAEDCWRRLAGSVGNWQLNGFGGWAVEAKDAGKLVGSIGFFTAWRDMDPEFGESPEMGWVMATETHGQGLAFEGCRAVLGWAEDNLEPTPIWAIINPDNEPSLKLADKLGFERLGDTVYQKEPIAVVRRPAW